MTAGLLASRGEARCYDEGGVMPQEIRTSPPPTWNTETPSMSVCAHDEEKKKRGTSSHQWWDARKKERSKARLMAMSRRQPLRR